MSEYGGCLVCGVVLGKDDYLLCNDCVYNGYMKQTGSLAKYIMITDDGPIEVGPPMNGIKSNDTTTA